MSRDGDEPKAERPAQLVGETKRSRAAGGGASPQPRRGNGKHDGEGFRPQVRSRPVRPRDTLADQVQRLDPVTLDRCLELARRHDFDGIEIALARVAGRHVLLGECTRCGATLQSGRLKCGCGQTFVTSL